MTSNNCDKSLVDYLKKVPDERNAHGRRHPLWLILIIMIMGIMSGYWGYRELGRFVERHRRELINLFQISRAEMPSYSTIRRVMMQIDYEQLSSVFNDWASQYTHHHKGQWIALDGKSLKNTVTDSHGREQNFITMVSAFSHQRGEILGLQVMENKKQSEINVVRELIELLDLSGVVFTSGCFTLSKKTLSAIVKSRNDYLVVVKKNQKTLHRQIESHANNTSPTVEFQQTEATRDRLTHRIIKVFTPPSNLHVDWVGVKSVVTVFRYGTRGNQDYRSSDLTFYLSSLSPDSTKIAQGIRQHWNIENRLHWIKDVVTKEDSSPQLHGHASTNISILKSWVLNLLRINGIDSITEAIDALAHNIGLIKSFCF